MEGTKGHLCAVGYNDSMGRPRVAAVASVADSGDHDDTGEGEEGGSGEEGGGEGPVMMLKQETLKAYWEDHKALECTRDGGGGLSCAPARGNSTASVSASASASGGWVGCGLMLSLGRDVDIGYGGLNCTSVSLEVVEF